MNTLKTSARLRWDKEPGFFEVWYLTFNDSKTGDGYWIRFTLVVPRNVLDSPFLNLWFTAFRDDGNISVISENYKISECNFSDEKIQIKDSFLSDSKTEGSITENNHKIRWELSLNDGGEFLHLPAYLYQIPVLHSYLASPNISFEIKGSITIDGDTKEIDGKGTQSHIWGRELPDNWIWAHTDNFENHRGFFEFLSVKTHLGLPGNISSTRIHLKFEDEEFSFFTLKNLYFKECLLFPEYLFFATGKRYKIEGKLYSEKNRFVQYDYPMPSNKEIFCSNTERGSLNIVVYKRESILKPFVYYTVLKNSNLTHYELGSNKKNQEIPVLNQH